MAQSKCTPEVIERAFELAYKGMSNCQIYNTLGISKDSFYAWQNVNDPYYNSDFSDNIKLARAELKESRMYTDEQTLDTICRGYTHAEPRTEYITDKATGKVTIKSKVVVEKYYPPDTKALIFRMTNQNPEKWKNRQNTELTGKNGKDLIEKEIDIDSLTPEQKATLLSLGENVIRDKEKNLEA